MPISQLKSKSQANIQFARNQLLPYLFDPEAQAFSRQKAAMVPRVVVEVLRSILSEVRSESGSAASRVFVRVTLLVL